MSKGKSRSALGINPLSQGIFSKMVLDDTPNAEDFQQQDQDDRHPDRPASQHQESSLLNIDSSQQSQTSPPSQSVPVAAKSPSSPSLDSNQQNQESIKQQLEPRFLKEEIVERVNLRLSVEIKDWLDTLLKQGKRTYVRKSAKETWVQAALELFRALPVDWQTIDSEESLRQVLVDLESRIKTKYSIFNIQ